MIIKGLIDTDFVNYKVPCMVIEFPYCNFKCDKECGQQVCQNSALATAPDIEISIDRIIERYINNPITQAICFQGLEPFDSIEMFGLVQKLREVTNDDIVIYTGYMKNEIEDLVDTLRQYPNIIIKYGRYIPNQEPHLDNVLGVKLASNNQYAERL